MITRLACLLALAFSLLAESPTSKHLKTERIELPHELKQEVLSKSHIIERVLKEEQKWSEDYFVLYHSGSNLFVVQELLSELLGSVDSFYWLRHPGQAKFASLNELFKSYPELNDEKVDVRSSLLSVNLSLFGSTRDLDSCSLAYWLQGRRAKHWYEPKELLAHLLELSGRGTDGLEELVDLYNWVQEQTLMQIFIPKEKKKELRECFYLSDDQGKPLESVLLNSKTNSSLPQARLLLNDAFLLNPHSGIKIKRYIFVDEKDKLELARKKIKEWGQKNTLN